MNAEQTTSLLYLDHAATTPMDPRVMDEMAPYFMRDFGNPSSATHSLGLYARRAVEQARVRIAETIGASEDEIILTSGATESDNHALIGMVLGKRVPHLITTATEHAAVLETAKYLESCGCDVTVLPVDSTGRVDPDDVRRALTPRTALISVMAANNETGTLHPVHDIGRIAHEAGVPFHTDAAQMVGKLPFDVREIQAALASISSHKVYGPKGVGALFVREGTPIAPLLHGGHQERGLRSGTVNVPGVVGFGRACALAREHSVHEAARLRVLRDDLHARIVARIDGVLLNGHPTERLPGLLNLCFPGADGERLIRRLARRIAVSVGSACSSSTQAASHVLTAMGRSPQEARASVRFSLGRFNTAEDIAAAATVIIDAVEACR